MPRRDPDRQLPRRAWADRRRRRRLRDEDGLLRQGRPARPGRHRPGPRADLRADRRRARRSDERRATCSGLAERAVEAAVAARRRRRRGLRARTRSAARSGSSTARSRASPRRASGASGSRLDRRPRRLRLRDRPRATRALRAIAADAVEAARVADPDEFAARARGRAGDAGAEIAGLSDPALAEAGRPSRRSSSRKAVEAAAREADDRVVGVETDGLRGRGGARGARLVDRARRRLRGDLAYAYLQAIAEGEGDQADRASASASAARPQALDPAAIGARGRRARGRRCSAPPSPRRAPARWCSTRPSPPASPASSAACCAPTRSSAAVRRSRTASARRSASAALTLADDGTDPEGLASLADRRRGRAPRAHGADRGGRARRLPPRLLHRPPRGRTAPAPPPTPRAPATARRPRSRPRTCRRARGTDGLEELLAEAGDGVYVTDVAGLHSGVNPVSGKFSVGATGPADRGRRAGRRRATSSRSPPTWCRCSRRSRPPAPRRAGCRSAARSRRRRS